MTSLSSHNAFHTPIPSTDDDPAVGQPIIVPVLRTWRRYQALRELSGLLRREENVRILAISFMASRPHISIKKLGNPAVFPFKLKYEAVVMVDPYDRLDNQV